MTIDLERPITFHRAVETAAAALTIALVRLRDVAAAREPDASPDPLPAAWLLVSMLEDALREAETLVEQME